MSAIELVSIINDIALTGAACVTAYVAYAGLGTWQKELSGKANFDVARELAKSLYALRDEISYCRSPFVARHEFPEGYRGSSGNHSAEENGRAWAHLFARRWEPVGKAAQAFDLATLEAEALWGKEIKGKALEMRKCIRELQVNIEEFIENKYSAGTDSNDMEFIEVSKCELWDRKGEKNGLTQRINKAIEGIESVILPHLSRS